MGGKFCDVEQGNDNENPDGLGRGCRRMRAGVIATVRPGIAPNTAPARAPVYGCPWHSSGPPPGLQSKKRQPEKNPKIGRDSSRVLWSEAVARRYFLIRRAVSRPEPARGDGSAVRITIDNPPVETGEMRRAARRLVIALGQRRAVRRTIVRRRRTADEAFPPAGLRAPRPVREDRRSGARRGRRGAVRNGRGHRRNYRIPSGDGLLRPPSCNSA